MRTDLNYLKTMSGDNQELIVEMIDIFIEQVSVYAVEMENFMALKDYRALGNLAHKARASISIMGMAELTEKLKELEKYTRNHENADLYPSIVNFFIHECREAIKELKNYKTLLTELKT
jgi:HPt (histidine-containing phosphotransfer) domain-containing protein